MDLYPFSTFLLFSFLWEMSIIWNLKIKWKEKTLLSTCSECSHVWWCLIQKMKPPHSKTWNQELNQWNNSPLKRVNSNGTNSLPMFHVWLIHWIIMPTNFFFKCSSKVFTIALKHFSKSPKKFPSFVFHFCANRKKVNDLFVRYH